MQPVTIYELEADEKRFMSPFCWAARFALLYKGLPVQTIPLHFQEQEKISFSKQGLVPVIVDHNNDSRCVNDSWAIAKYLEKTYPNMPSLFNGVSGESLSLFIVQKIVLDIAPAFELITILDEYKILPPETQPWFKEKNEARVGPLEKFCKGEAGVGELRKKLHLFREILQTYPFLGGNSLCYADICLLGFFMSACAVSPIHLLSVDDPLFSWRERMLKSFQYPENAHGRKFFTESLQ